MNRRARQWASAGMVSLALLVPVGSAAEAATDSQANPDGTVVAVSPSTVASGEILQVSGFDFPPGIDVSGQICGNDNLSGSADCVLDNTGIAGTTSQGRFTMSISVAIPPVPCPCVAVVSSTSMPTTPSSPITIVGAPIAPLRPPTSAATVTQPLQILNAQLSGNGPWYSWFGGIPQRTLDLTVHNPNRGVYPHPALVLAAGKAGNGLSTVSTSPLPSMAPGETTTVHLKVTFPPFNFGTNEVIGTVGDATLKENIKVTTTIVPWGLIIVALIILQFILLAIRNALRRRNQRRQVSSPASGPTGEQPCPPSDHGPIRESRERQTEEVGAV